MNRAVREAFTSVFRPEGRTAPLQGDTRRGLEPARIPWEVHEAAWRGYAELHSGQSAERIAERGGFGHMEVIAGLWAELVRLRGKARNGD